MAVATRTFAGLAAGFVVGLTIAGSSSPAATAVTSVSATLGTLFVNLIRMTVVPLIVSLLVATVGSAAATTHLGRTGLKALAIAVAQLVVAAVASGVIAHAAISAMTIDREAARALATSSAAVATTAGPAHRTSPRGSPIWCLRTCSRQRRTALCCRFWCSPCFSVSRSRKSTKRRATPCFALPKASPRRCSGLS